MANILKIKHRYTGNAGAPASLGRSELAFNELSSPAGGILYIGTAGETDGDADTKLAIGGPGAYTDLASAQTVTNKTLGSGNTWNGNVLGAAYLPDATTSAQGVAQFHSDNFSVTSGTVTIGLPNDVVIAGNLTVNGSTTTVNSTTVSVDDKNLELGSVATPTDSTADGGGITLKGASDKTIIWENDDDSWHFNQGINLNDNSLLNATIDGGTF